MTNPSRDKIAARLRSLRAERGVSQDDVADALGVSQNAMTKWESAKGQASPRAEWVAKLADYYDVSADYLVCRSDFKSGLPPDKWIVNMDLFRAAEVDAEWCYKVPRDLKLVEHDEMVSMRLDVGRRAKIKQTGKP
jgi:transcriptional regulator with XRE-family HTH domain